MDPSTMRKRMKIQMKKNKKNEEEKEQKEKALVHNKVKEIIESCFVGANKFPVCVQAAFYKYKVMMDPFGSGDADYFRAGFMGMLNSILEEYNSNSVKKKFRYEAREETVKSGKASFIQYNIYLVPYVIE